MSKGVEIAVGIFAFLCYAGCGYAIIFDALKRNKISKFSIIISFIFGGFGLWGAFADYGTLRIGGYIWTAIWLTKAIIECVRYKKIK
ncbi:hypothetical protein OBV_03510 [Oscillibacter valericigenes Sjm18-20]|nr:hypothetical protein OBV_03510 [Oscillibacter valericigenes Sjm18-20]